MGSRADRQPRQKDEVGVAVALVRPSIIVAGTSEWAQAAPSSLSTKEQHLTSCRQSKTSLLLLLNSRNCDLRGPSIAVQELTRRRFRDSRVAPSYRCSLLVITIGLLTSSPKMLSSFRVSHDRTILCNSWSSSLGKQRPTLCISSDRKGFWFFFLTRNSKGRKVVAVQQSRSEKQGAGKMK